MQPVNNEVANGLNDSDEFDLINSAKSVGSMGVLRPQSSFSGIKLGTVDSAEAVPGKRLTFADEHGEILVVNVFVDQLHYGHNNSSLPSMGSVSAGKCCIVS